ncbi:hypothetical protein ACFPRL_31960 [Pseudoclavibacter helvolus]
MRSPEERFWNTSAQTSAEGFSVVSWPSSSRSTSRAVSSSAALVLAIALRPYWRSSVFQESLSSGSGLRALTARHSWSGTSTTRITTNSSRIVARNSSRRVLASW